ncbi:major facilitator superfamily MFS_1 [Methylobacterium sp. 4-46]|uniref:MFS transporter n=1 Tax=unclassified Methylobacterium TaxID=2615210 RepID=UPI000165C99A|nr:MULTISPECIES: MFS transporter [Methylobacterium]ACA15422.1 major facilitator superfamily MFS_1 [Methylobacterium sp. 4-46]WFT81141.1 MFS transporter [Methylobacterium nodulans]
MHTHARMTSAPPPISRSNTMSAGLTVLFACAVGVVVLSLYASQPLIGLIGSSFSLSTSEASLVSTLTLLGYASGLFLLVPLTDLVENRTVIVVTLLVDVAALAAIALAPTPFLFLLASYVAGVTTSAIQMLVPVAAQLSPEAHRGRVVGNVMSGLMLGILLSRPAASWVAEFVGWRWFYGGLSLIIAALSMILATVLPVRKPATGTNYSALIGSMLTILREEPVLRRRASYQALCMGAFGVFWTSVALRLSDQPFSLGQTGIGLFALAGAAGAVVAPIAGRAGDRGWTRSATRLAHLAVIAAMILAGIGGDVLVGTPFAPSWAPLAILVASAVLLDLGVIGDQTLGRRAINLLRPEARGRVNGLFTGLFFLGAAAGSALSGLAWVSFGWLGVCSVGLAFGCVTLVLSSSQPQAAAR